MKLLTAQQMKEIDRLTIEEHGVSAESLMEEAGRKVALDVADHYEMGSVIVICGKGNNGGDGFVTARYLAEAGWKTSVAYIEEPAEGTTTPKVMWEKLPEAINKFKISEVEDLTALVSSFDVAVDALLGIGISGELKAPYDTIIKSINDAHIPVFSIDIPSGLNPDEGIATEAIRAWRTVTLGLPKLGMVRRGGAYYSGGIRVERLQFPKALLDAAPSTYETLTHSEASALLPVRPPDAHKGTFGMVLVVAGSGPMPGAAMLAGYGALRGGCGLVRLHVPESVRSTVSTQLPEAMFTHIIDPKTEHRKLSKKELKTIMLRVNALAVGPGMGQATSTRDLVRQLLEETEVPMVIDADAINIISQVEGLRDFLGAHHILTPHPGELARILGVSNNDIQADRWKYAALGAQQLGCTVLLKGYGTLIAETDGRITHIPAGNTAWARGGSGDVLTGLIGSLLAQGLTPANAAKLGAFVHGMAADIYTRDKSPRAALIREVGDCLPMAFQELES